MSDIHVHFSGNDSETISPDEAIAEDGNLSVFLSGYFRKTGQVSAYSQTPQSLLEIVKHLPEGELPLLEGSFCAAIHDSKARTLWLITDLYGTRPLYYCRHSQETTVSTSLVSLLNGKSSLTIPKEALADSMALGFVRAPGTMVEGISRVSRNSCVQIHLADGRLEVTSLPNRLASNPPVTANADTLVKGIKYSLEQEFRVLARTHSKVAVLLSGGVDSSILASYASEHFDQPVAFSCEIEGFDNPELERARYVAQKLKLPHEVIWLRKSDVPELFKRVVRSMEGPSRHINNIVTQHLFDAIRGYDAIIGGDGADALFGSGNQKTISNEARKLALIDRWPKLIRIMLCHGLGALHISKKEQLQNLLIHDVHWFIDHLFTIDYGRGERSVAEGLGIPPFKAHGDRFPESRSVIAKSIEANFELFLNSMLMRNSQLSRNCNAPLYYPFLTEDMLKVSRGVPDDLRFDKLGNAKPLVREVCRQRLGSTITEWPKLGFVTPEKSWLNNELREYVERVFGNAGGLNKVLDLSLNQSQKDALSRSTRLLWWLTGLDESLLMYQEALSESVELHEQESAL